MSPRRGATPGPVVVDCSALQSPTSRGRGIGEYAEQWALALEASRPDLVGRYLLDPAFPPPGALEALVATGKLAYRQHPGDLGLPAARLFHCLSPFDLAAALPGPSPRQARAGLRSSATVYDLIPALDPGTELADPLLRRRYRTRLEWVRAADQVQVLSASVGRDLHRLLALSPEKVVLTGAAPADRFRPAGGPEDLAPARGLLGDLDRPFVLHPGGSHPRKNNERLIEAWGLLPERLRAARRLVITGEVAPSTARHYRHLAHLGGFEDRLVVAGRVPDDVLLALYQGAELVCFPSAAEGYGLPVAEAIACRTPVIASDVAPLDELLGPEARFDPATPASIAAALGAVLAEPERRLAVREAAFWPLRSFDAVAEATGAAFDRLLAGPPAAGRGAPRTGRPSRPRPRPRLRIAFVSPFPPAPTGVAAYSYRLVEELVAAGSATVDAYLDGPTRPQLLPPGVTGRPAASLPDVERLLGPYDARCYCLGNSHHHLGALALLRRAPGTVIAHDVRLSNCYRHESGDPGLLPGGLGRAIRRLYPEAGLPEGLGDGGELDSEELARYGLLMAREAIGASEAFLVSSAAAASLARLDARPGDAHRIGVLPFAFEAPAPERSRFEDEPAAAGAPLDGEGDGEGEGRGSGGSGAEGDRLLPGALGEGPLLAHFGLVDPVKLPEVLLEATALLLSRFPDLRCAFVGPVSAALADRLRARATELGCSDALLLTGPLPPAPYRAFLERATVAVQLRAAFNGEASAAVGECLASGVPTVVSRIGWARELPADAVVGVPSPVSPEELAGRLAPLLTEERRRAALGAAGRRQAERRSFAATAAALLDRLEATSPASGGTGGRSAPSARRQP